MAEAAAAAAPVSGIRPPMPLCMEANLAENWRAFKQRWQNYAIITNLERQTPKYQVALLLHVMGDQALKAYNGFQFDTTEDNRTIDEIIAKFDTFAVGEVNETYERYVFNRREQNEGESFENFISSLRTLIKSCRYCNGCINSMLRDRIVLGVRDNTTQQMLLRERDLTLEKAINICKAAETATAHSKTYRMEHDTVNKLTAHKRHESSASQQAGKQTKPNTARESKLCKFCGYNHVLQKEKCPAWGKLCKNCSGRNHFAKQCKGRVASAPAKAKPKAVHNVNEADSDASDEWIYSVETAITKLSRDIKCEMRVGDKMITFQIDTGASVNVLPAKYAPNVTQTSKTLIMWNGNRLTPRGTCRTTVFNPKNLRRYNVEFVVVEGELTPLIGLSAALQMNLISVNESNMSRVNNLSDSSICEKYKDVFDGRLGKFEGDVQLQTDSAIQPVVMPTKRCPLAIRAKLKAELDRMQRMGVITPVDEPTPWVSQMVTTMKRNGDLRICICPLELNKALRREHYVLPTLDDTLHELGKSKFFTKADMSTGFWHVQLTRESSLLTTFQTCFGRYCWLRLPFGTSVSSEIFAKKLAEALDRLPGVICIADDVVIHGATEEEHDNRLENFLLRCRQKGIKLNKDKLELKMREITFMGHRIGASGLMPDPEKVKAITEMKAPKNIEELRRFLGIINFLAKYLPRLATATEVLRNLTKKDVEWNWSAAQETAFQSVKKMITSQHSGLGIYDPNAELELECDASDYGLGNCIYQNGRPISYASRSLTETERRYAQIEKEMLALVFGLEKNHHFVFGRHVRAITDHKPLVAILAKPLSKAPRRLQAMILRTQRYSFSLEFRPGKSIPIADALSRAPLDETAENEPTLRVSNVDLCPISDSRLAAIRDATERDDALQALCTVITNGWPDKKAELTSSVAVYYSYRDELSIQDGIILRGERVVIPQSLRADMKRRVHSGHLGINSCLRRARDVIFWPGMSSEIRQYVESCNVCATYCDKQQQETLIIHETCSRPWQKVGTDLFTLHGRSYLVTVDYCSHFFELDYLSDTLAETVVAKLKHHFARHGIPDVLISDGGPQYTAHAFKKFSDTWQFQHIVTSAGNSKANGAAEATVKVAKRLLRKCQANLEDPHLGLLNLRNTPTEGLGVSPAQRLFGRRTKTTMPTTNNSLKPRFDDSQTQLKQDSKRATMARRADERRRDLRPLEIGEAVRLQPLLHHQKEWRPATVSRRLTSRTYEVQTPEGRTLRRNRLLLRPSRATGSIHGKTDDAVRWHGKSTISDEQPTNSSLPQSQINNDNTQTAMAPRDNAQSYVTRSGRVSKPPEKLNL